MVQSSTSRSKSKIKVFIGGGLLIVLLISFVSILAFGLVKAKSGPRDSGLAPDFTLTAFDGKKITLSELRGQVVVINFWASWCLPCRQEAAYLENTWRKYKDKGVVFIGVDYLDTDIKALAYIQEFGITYFNGPDLASRIAQSYNIQGVPETYFVDQGGQLRGVDIGPEEPPRLDEQIDSLLSQTDITVKP